MSVFQLIYKSVCRSGVTLAELREIARVSAEKNRAKGITGVMLVQGRDVLQILEGEQAVVTALYDTIASDLRHGDCRTLLTRQASERAFGTWSMALCEVDEDEADLFRMAVSTIKARARQREKLSKKTAA